MKPQLPKIKGLTAHDIFFKTDLNAAHDLGEELTKYGFIVEYENTGNCIAIITKTLETRPCATSPSL